MNQRTFLSNWLDGGIRLLVLISPKMSGCLKTFKVNDGDRGENNKLMSFCITDEKLLEKYKTILDYDWRLKKY